MVETEHILAVMEPNTLYRIPEIAKGIGINDCRTAQGLQALLNEGKVFRQTIRQKGWKRACLVYMLADEHSERKEIGIYDCNFNNRAIYREFCAKCRKFTSCDIAGYYWSNSEDLRKIKIQRAASSVNPCRSA